MKKYLFITLMCFFLFGFQGSFALTYNSDFTTAIEYGENSPETINKAKLLEKYVRNYKNGLDGVVTRLEITNSSTINSIEGELETMIDALIKVQSKYVEENDAEEIISSVVQGLKKVNGRLEPYIKTQQKIYQEKLNAIKRNYIVIGNRISDSLLVFIRKLSVVLSEKPQLSQKQKEVVKSLARLNETREKLEEFAETKFQNKDQMKEYLGKVIASIRTELKLIKSLL